MKKINQFKTLFYLVFREMLIFKKMAASKLIDIFIITVSNIIVFTYLMPYFGLKSNYGPFIAVGLVIAIAFFDIIPKVTNLVSDIGSNKKISYMLTLPITANWVFLAILLSWGICSAIYVISVLPIAKLFLLSKFSLDNFNIFKFIISFIVFNLSFAAFGLFLTSLIKDIKYISWIWARVVNPLFMLGGYFYTWYSVFSVSKIAGIINFFNPILLATESIRAAVLGQKGFLNFWLSSFCLILYGMIFAYFGIKRLKKRLDCV